MPPEPVCYRTYNPGHWIGSTEAKKEYFLTPDDLRMLSVHSVGGGVGCGRPMAFYDPAELKRAAIRKHGQEGYANKQAAREKREANKRRREDEAENAYQTMQNVQTMQKVAVVDLTDDRVIAGNSAAAQPATNASVATMRKGLLKMAKKSLGFTDSGAPKRWRIEVPAVDKAIRMLQRMMGSLIFRGSPSAHY